MKNSVTTFWVDSSTFLWFPVIPVFPSNILLSFSHIWFYLPPPPLITPFVCLWRRSCQDRTKSTKPIYCLWDTVKHINPSKPFPYHECDYSIFLRLYYKTIDSFSIFLVYEIQCNFSLVSVSISTVILASCSFVYFSTVYQSLTNGIYCSEIPLPAESNGSRYDPLLRPVSTQTEKNGENPWTSLQSIIHNNWKMLLSIHQDDFLISLWINQVTQVLVHLFHSLTAKLSLWRSANLEENLRKKQVTVPAL